MHVCVDPQLLLRVICMSVRPFIAYAKNSTPAVGTIKARGDHDLDAGRPCPIIGFPFASFLSLNAVATELVPVPNVLP